MNGYKRRKITIITLVAALLLALVAALFMGGISFTSASAADPRYIELHGSNIFNVDNIGGAVISYWKGESTTETTDGNEKVTDHYYTQFEIKADQTISYRQNLAYFWKTGAYENGLPTGTVEDHYFNMELGFANTDFDKYIIKFQSQQYSYAEKEITENFLVFTAVDGGIKLAVKHSLDDEVEPVAVGIPGDKIKIEFSSFSEGNYTIKVSVNGSVVSESFKFVNVAKAYATYQSSGDNAVTPLTFSAEFTDAQKGAGNAAKMIMFSINGQSFEKYDRSNDGSYTYVMDTAAPVMCFAKTPSYIEYGKSINFEYKTIDVLASSPRTTAYYYVLSGDQYADGSYKYDKTSAKWDEEIKADDSEDKPVNPYIQVTTESDVRIVRDDNTFIPSEYTNSDKDYRVYGLVKLYYEISDVSATSSTAQKDTICPEWYAKPEALVNIYDIRGGSGKSNFFKLMDGKEGVTLATADDIARTDATIEEVYAQRVNAIQTYYQARIDDAISKLKDKDSEDGSGDGKLFAGGNNNFYLPSLEDDFTDCSLDAYNRLQDYKFAVFYQTSNGTSNSNKGLAYNKMYIGLKEANTTYYFKIYITDAFSNTMRYPKTAEDGSLEWCEIKESDIWDKDYDGLLPEFSFKVDYKTAVCEAPKKLSLAYVDTSYSGVSFKITGVADSYSTSYELYIFDRNAMYEKTGKLLSYNDLNENFEALFDNTYDTNINTRAFFTTVKPSSSLVSTDPNYELFKSISWNETGISFVPQSVDDFYVVRLTLEDNVADVTAYSHAVVMPSVKATALAGESEWVKNNITSIVLLAVAGACLIGLLILLIVKPKDKGDIDAVYVEEEKEKKAKSGKKAKNQ